MNRLEHINLVVEDMNATQEFLLTALPNWRVRGQGKNEWYGKKRQWMHLGTDDYYITLNQGNSEPNRDLQGHSPGLAHIGLEVDDLENLADRMKSAGYEPTTVGAEHPFRKTLYFIDPAGFEFEFIQYLSDQPEERNLYGGETSTIIRLNHTDKGRDNRALVKELYRRAVDGRDADQLAPFLADDVRFQIGNHPSIMGKAAVLDANRNFFSSIAQMSHRIDGINSLGDTIFCHGQVNYLRLDGTPHSAEFATLLKLTGGKIRDYQVYADISQL